MPEQPSPGLGETWRNLRPRLLRLWVGLLAAWRTAWGYAKPPLLALLQILAALIVLFEEWGWRPLVELIGRLSRFKPWAAMERWIAGLPPYGALFAFALPTTLLLPLKLVAVYLLSNGMVLAAGALFIGAKIASTALIARIFMLTKPALMQIGWFASAYNIFMPWKEAIFAQIRTSWAWRYGRMVKTRVKLEAKHAWARWKPQLQAAWGRWRPRLLNWGLNARVWLAARWARVAPALRQLRRDFTLRVRAMYERYFGQTRNR
jgi:hypothetical protein